MGAHILHSPEAIQGIGEAIAARLKRRGILYAEDLLTIPDRDLRKWADAVPRLTVKNLSKTYIPQARMIQIKGVSGQYAEGLVASGLASYRALVNTDAAGIVRLLN